MKIKVAVLGAKGRMGTESVKAISAANDLDLVASLDLGDSLDLLKSSGAKVVLDFTHPDSVMKNLEYAINSGINVVVGTTGFDSRRIEEVKAMLAKNPSWSNHRAKLWPRGSLNDAVCSKGIHLF